MASERDPRYTQAFGEKPHTGRRYVEAGRVRIEWTEQGKRRRRTIGPNTPKTRKQADARLRDILSSLESSGRDPDRSDEKVRPNISLPDPVRRGMLALMDTADSLGEWFAESARQLAGMLEPNQEEPGEE